MYQLFRSEQATVFLFIYLFFDGAGSQSAKRDNPQLSEHLCYDFKRFDLGRKETSV